MHHRERGYTRLMSTLRRRLAVLGTVAGLVALGGCQTDDAIKEDTKGADERAEESAKDAGNAIEKGFKDVDGR